MGRKPWLKTTQKKNSSNMWSLFSYEKTRGTRDIKRDVAQNFLYIYSVSFGSNARAPGCNRHHQEYCIFSRESL